MTDPKTFFITDVERAAFEDLHENEILVFGHTHRPFVRQDGRIINTGCWVSDSTNPNTFAELDDGQVKLFKFLNKNNIQDITTDASLPVDI